MLHLSDMEELPELQMRYKFRDKIYDHVNSSVASLPFSAALSSGKNIEVEFNIH